MATVASALPRRQRRRAITLTSALLCAGGYLPDATAGGIQEPAPSESKSLPAVTVTAGSVAQAQAAGDSASEGYIPRDQILSRPLL